MQHIINSAKEVAVQVIREAGLIAKERFDTLSTINVKDEYGDVVTEVDFQCEAVILKAINEHFPEHQIRSEEAGSNNKESDWLWMIDPLDGTNNYAISLPIFAISITLIYQKVPVLGVVYEPMTDRLFVTSIGEGSYCNDKAISVKESTNVHRANLGWIQGHGVQNDVKAVQLRNHIDTHCKRMMRLWAPTLQWCMLARGDLDGIVLYNSEGDDLYSGILMVKEAGAIVIDFNGNPFTEMMEEPYLIACHPAHQEYFMKLVEEGLS
ncbi:inositol monophosphatase family protein [Paenibacillus pini]|uniref:Inositol-1-monophosphatase n=1 Tax=Paenibacillus pini JCM 16418 TaxID=1236976 RepID=W7YNA3_9BACL|nr:inositol monophosphatase family protein [Paenibacillus pini]GAF06106.1 inositol-1-monophosphatase [Paenibacillus pini JCM 16418]